MYPRLLAVLRHASVTVVVVFAFVNLWRFTQNISYLPERSRDEIVIWEDRLRGVRNALMKVHYMRGDVGYMRASVLSGKPATGDDDKNWGEARYGMIPWNLLRHSLEAPYVVVDFSGAEVRPALPEGFTTLYESADGLFVLQRTSPR